MRATRTPGRALYMGWMFLIITASASPQATGGAAGAAPHPRSNASRARTKPQRPDPPLSDRERALQMLNRFTFGPRPGDLAAVMQMGPDAWFEQQLAPSAIADAAADKRAADYPALRLSPDQLVVNFPNGQILRQTVDGKRPLPEDPTLAAVYQVLLARYEKQQQEQKSAAALAAASAQLPPPVSAPVPVAVPPAVAPRPGRAVEGATASGIDRSPMDRSGMYLAPPAAAGNTTPNAGRSAQMAGASTPAIPGPAAPNMDQAAAQVAAQKAAQKKQDQAAAQTLADQLLSLPKNQRMAAVLKLPVPERMVLTASVGDPQKGMLMADFNPREREIFTEMGGGPDAGYMIDNELQQAKLVRAILSERQLQEVMTDFWFNHFNVSIHKDQALFYTPSYERDAIRAHALGKFRDLLLATAQHPAMLVYLDNFQSIGPDSPAAGKPKPGQKQAQRGLNENYGREVMELHTVGVNGGYSQADVTNLAKILTGWTIDHPELGGGMVFDPRKHEPGAKKWFGQTVKEDGFAEGRDALAWLAAQPQTAHFVSYKLAQRFVADQPPPALVERMAKTFLDSDGDIKEVLRTMVHSPEFNSRRYYRDKVKTPLEFVASAFRATGTNPASPAALVGVLKAMGEPLYGMLPPTGYAMTADAWMNSGALVDRLNFSLGLANSRIANMKFDAPHLLAAGLLARPAEEPDGRIALHTAAMTQAPGAVPSGGDEALRILETLLIGGQISAKTNGVIQTQMASDLEASPPVDPAQTLDTMTALILGSPEFQMR